MRGIVLAAGFATRLYPLTRDRAKPLLSVGGATILDHILSRLEALEALDEVLIVTNGKFHQAFVEWAAARQGRLPLRLLSNGVVHEDERLGAVRDMERAMVEVEDETEWIVVAGDNLFDFSLAPFLRLFRERGAPLLLLRRLTPPVPAARYNEVTVDGEGWVTRFREKPEDPKPGRAAICLYFFSADVPSLVTRYLAGGGKPDAPGYFISWLVEQRRVAAADVTGQWFDIGDRAMLEETRRCFARRLRSGD